MFKPKDLLDFAGKIRTTLELQNEAGVRTTINRSYYSSLLEAKLHLENEGENFTQDEEIHKNIIEKVKEKNAMMGDKLNNLHDLRTQADFDFEFNANKSFISVAHGMAKSFNDKVQTKIK